VLVSRPPARGENVSSGNKSRARDSRPPARVGREALSSRDATLRLLELLPARVPVYHVGTPTRSRQIRAKQLRGRGNSVVWAEELPEVRLDVGHDRIQVSIRIVVLPVLMGVSLLFEVLAAPRQRVNGSDLDGGTRLQGGAIPAPEPVGKAIAEIQRAVPTGHEKAMVTQRDRGAARLKGDDAFHNEMPAPFQRIPILGTL
jgi:hypothetical protein